MTSNIVWTYCTDDTNCEDGKGCETFNEPEIKECVCAILSWVDYEPTSACIPDNKCGTEGLYPHDEKDKKVERMLSFDCPS